MTPHLFAERSPEHLPNKARTFAVCSATRPDPTRPVLSTYVSRRTLVSPLSSVFGPVISSTHVSNAREEAGGR